MRWFFFLSLPAPFISYAASPQASLWAGVGAARSGSVSVLLAFSFLAAVIVEVNVSAAAGGRRTCVHLFLPQVHLCKHAAGDNAEAPEADPGPRFTKPSEKTATFDEKKKLFKRPKQRIVGDGFPSPGFLPGVSYTGGPEQHEPTRQKMVTTPVGEEPFCFEIDPEPSDVSGWVGVGQGWRLITDIREVIGLLFSNWCL